MWTSQKRRGGKVWEIGWCGESFHRLFCWTWRRRKNVKPSQARLWVAFLIGWEKPHLGMSGQVEEEKVSWVKFLSCSVGLSFANLEESFKFIPQASGRAVSANCVLWRLLRGHCIVLVSSQTELPWTNTVMVVTLLIPQVSELFLLLVECRR